MRVITALEELIRPYETSEWGYSDGFGNTYQEYSKDGITSRIDTATWFLAKNPKQIYLNELIRVATELKLKPQL
jgi:hypothetical protein